MARDHGPGATGGQGPVAVLERSRFLCLEAPGLPEVLAAVLPGWAAADFTATGRTPNTDKGDLTGFRIPGLRL